ncbi:hypothetical protein LX36DRAFT_753432 [Colletotrichum falcatum]|nr:hypothetical protein LX36DRAFT_753432 [Colletotrichum falcatum]
MAEVSKHQRKITPLLPPKAVSDLRSLASDVSDTASNASTAGFHDNCLLSSRNGHRGVNDGGNEQRSIHKGGRSTTPAFHQDELTASRLASSGTAAPAAHVLDGASFNDSDSTVLHHSLSSPPRRQQQ